MEKMPYKTYLEENEIPAAWYNLRADMKNKPAPLLNPAFHRREAARGRGGGGPGRSSIFIRCTALLP